MTGPVLENVIEGAAVNVLAFPAPKWHEDDGGHYIGTECMVITQDPDNDWVNLGTYRVQVQDKNTLVGLHRARQARRRHPPQILGARRALPDGDQRRPGAGAGRGRRRRRPAPNVSEYDDRRQPASAGRSR